MIEQYPFAVETILSAICIVLFKINRCLGRLEGELEGKKDKK